MSDGRLRPYRWHLASPLSGGPFSHYECRDWDIHEKVDEIMKSPFPGDMPRAVPGAPPPKPMADVARAPWYVFMTPLKPALMAPAARRHMAALAVFVAALADIATMAVPEDERIKRVEALELALAGAFGPALSRPELLPAVILRDSMLETGGSFADALALADATRDEICGKAATLRPGSQELMDHAARASAPVLRYLSHLHGEVDEVVLRRADDLARAWFVLRNAARWPEGAVENIAELLRAARGLHRQVSDKHLMAQTYSLYAMAECALRALRKRGAKADPLSAISPLDRARIAIAARLRLSFG